MLKIYEAKKMIFNSVLGFIQSTFRSGLCTMQTIINVIIKGRNGRMK